MKEYDVLVIGSGPGGYVAAIRASQMGARVGMIEKDSLGGTCLNRGCIPTKCLVASTSLFERIRKAKEFGIRTGESSVDFTAMMERKDRVVKGLKGGLEQILKSRGIEIIKGEARFKNASLIEAAGDTITGKKIIIATGSVPAAIPSIPVDGKAVITSDHVLGMKELPSSVLIVGGGVIGVEFACIFATLGTRVKIIEMLPRIIPTEDDEISHLLNQTLTRRGMEIRTDTKINSVNTDGGVAKAVISSGEELTAERILVSTGRSPFTDGLGLEQAGVRTERRRIPVNEKMETNVPGIYAVGDVTGGILLAYVASQQGIVAAENACGKESGVDYNVVPNCIYSSPEIASVGMSEAKAAEKGYKVKIGKFPFRASGKAIILGETEGLVKVIADEATEKLLGVHIMGIEATELIAEAAMAMKSGATTRSFLRICHGHPTLHEAMLEAAHDVHGNAIDLGKR